MSSFEFEIPSNAICYLSSQRGQYIPQNFFEQTKPECINWNDISISLKDWILNSCENPENESYWDAWIDVLDGVTVTNPDTGVECYLHHDEDLWLIPIDPKNVAEVTVCHD